MMLNKTSIKTRMGWISVFEENGKIFQIKFGKIKKQSKSKVLEKFKKNLFKFFKKKIFQIEIPYKTKGNPIQIKVWNELKKIKAGQTKTYGEVAKKFKISPRHVGKICSQNKLLFAPDFLLFYMGF